MRVCFLDEGAEWSGSARAFAEAARALGTRGYDVTMAGREGSAVGRRWREAGLNVLPLPATGSRWRAAWALRGVLDSRFVEVVFVHSEHEQLVAAVAVRLAGRGAVVRRVPPYGRLTVGAEARLAGRLAATGFLFAFSEDLRAAQPQSWALEPVVAPPAVEAQPVPRVPAGAGDARTIACLFGAPPHVRVTATLRAMALLAERHSDVRLALIGPRADDDALRIQAAALGIGGVVSRTVDPSERSAILRRATIALVLADGDDAAYGLLDCFAAGVPVVTSRDPLTTRFITDGANGLLASALDSAALAAVIAALLADGARLDRLARGTLESVERWPVPAMADGFERAAATARDRTRWRF
jgi:hypothetical protein